MSARTRKDWILWAQLGCALVATAHAEYTLATAVHLNGYVALAVPGALDLYVVRALQKRKDVLPAVLVMVAANIASILVAAGVLPLHWALYSAVGALAPLLVWRGHVLRVHEGGAAEMSTAAPMTSPEVTPTVPAPASAPEYDAPDYIPDWVSEERTAPVPASAPALPALPPEYAPVVTARIPEYAWDELTEADRAHLPRAEEYVAECTRAGVQPSVRALKTYASVGQDRARRLLLHLEAKS